MDTPASLLNRRDFLAGTLKIAALAAVTRLAPQTLAAPPRPPNIIIILADDLGYGDLGCFGNELIRTPHIDSLARDGVRFTDFYSCSPVCTPARAALISGAYPTRFGLAQGVLYPDARIGLAPSSTTLGNLAKAQGYTTACVGKWHLGDAPEFLPRQHGFDLYRGVPYSHDMFIRRGDQRGVPFMDGDEIVEHPTNLNTLTERFTTDAVNFIHANKDKPFLLFFSHIMPHIPLTLPDYARGSRGGRYGDAVEHIDWSVGQVLQAVAQHGLERNTLILFTSDNGPWLERRPNAGTADPLRGGKTTTWEGGIRVPCVARWTGHAPAGKDCSEIATLMDLVPTLAALNGVSWPADAPIDGHDLLPLLQSPTEAQTSYEAFFYYSHRAGPVAGARRGRFKFVGNDETANPELYDLVEDIGETTNVAEAHPDVVLEMRQLIRDHRAKMQRVRRPPARSSLPRVGNKPDRGANDS